jgi:ketosteroid isomerase-like protein
LRGQIGLALGLLLATSSCHASAPAGSRNDVALADTLKRVIEQAYDFSRPDIVQRMNALYPDTGQVISASGGQIVASADSIRRGIAAFWDNVGRNMHDPKWHWGHVFVDRLGPDAAAMTATWSIPHTTPLGGPHVIQGAWTAVFRRIGGRWVIVMEHLSTPPPPS